jgi:hypothetical protein
MMPSHTIIESSNRTFTTVDTRGRRLTFRRLTALDTLRLFKAAGPVLSQNEAWLAMSGLAFSILEIDGVPVPAPSTEVQIEGLIDRLGDEGLAAVATKIRDDEPTFETQADVGNLLGTLS